MKKIYFAFFDGKSIVSKFIKFWTRSEYSHVGYLNLDERFYVEAWVDEKNNIFNQYWQEIDFQKNNLEYAFKNHKKGTIIEIWSLDVEDEEYNYINDFFKKMAKKKTRYDYKAIVSFLFRLKKQSSNKYFCSEGCVAPLKFFRDWKTINPAFISPGDFIKIIEVIGGKMEQIIVI